MVITACHVGSYLSVCLVYRLVRRRRTPPPPRDFQTPNAAGTSPAYVGVRRAFSDFNKILSKYFSFEDFRVTDSGKGKLTSDTHILVA